MPWQPLVKILRRRDRLAASAIALASLLAVAPARGQTAAPPPPAAQAPAPRADARELQARALFARGRYTDALEIYVALYAETTHPTYIRNIGRCYQNLGDADNAISTFREYLRQAKTLTPKQREEIEGYIREMEELKQRRAAQGTARPAATREQPAAAESKPASAPPRARPRGAAVASRDSVDVIARPASGSEDAGGSAGGRKVAAIVTGAAGVAALGVGAFFGLRALSRRQASDELCSTNPCGSMDGVQLNNEAETAARIADFAVGAGVVAVGVAAVLFVTARSTNAPATQASAAGLRFAPTVGVDGRSAALSLAGSW